MFAHEELKMNSHSKKILECPFTWNLDGKGSPKSSRTEEKGEYYIPVLISSIMNTYTLSKNGNDYKAFMSLQETNEIWENLDIPTLQRENVSLKVVYHILEATKYFVLAKANDLRRADNILKTLEDSESFKNQADLGTLYGCKSIAMFYTDEINAISLTRRAILTQPNCPLWHFVLAKQLRRVRRITERMTNTKPSNEEIQEFLMSYKMSKNPYYGVFVAQAYRENNEYTLADKVYLDIYNMKPENLTIQLRLALGFLRKYDFYRAKSCLDFVENAIPDNAMFLHYKGIYFQKKRDYMMASKYFHESAKKRNFAADLQYISCMRNIDKTFNSVEHLQYMLQKYQDSYADDKQNILLMMAIHCCNDNKDFIGASKCFSQAISINPKSYKLQKFFNVIENKQYNIFSYIHNKLLSRRKKNTKLENTLKELESLYDKYKIVY